MQTATGFNWAEAEAFAKFNGLPVVDKPEPRALPVQALDHVAGYFLAFGIQAAIAKTITVSPQAPATFIVVVNFLKKLLLDRKAAPGKSVPL